MNNTDGEGEEGEEEQDDILIVEGDDDEIEDDDNSQRSPANVRGKSASNLRLDSNGGSPGKAKIGGVVQTNKSLNATSHAEVNAQLYGGDIYLLGGSHCIVQDQNN